MESSTLFTVSNIRRVRTGTVLLVIANQTRRSLGLEDIQVHDTIINASIAKSAMEILINNDKSFL